jgi:hypothetical protein
VIEAVSARIQRQFSEALSRYRELAREASQTGGELPDEKVDEVLELAKQLGIPPTRFTHDATSFVAAGNYEKRIAEIQARNAHTTVDVPALEAKADTLTKTFLREKRAWEIRSEELQRELSEIRRTISAEVHRPRESTREIESQLRRVYDSNPVVFRSGVIAEDLPRLLEVRQSTVGGVA